MSWISVEDRLPKKNSLVAWIKMNDPIKNGVNKRWVSKIDDVGFSENHDGYSKNLSDIDATHWVQLPDLPNE